jgi:hypothetical protein
MKGVDHQVRHNCILAELRGSMTYDTAHSQLMQIFLSLHITWDQQIDESTPSSTNAGNRILFSCAASADLPSFFFGTGNTLDLGIQKGTVQHQPSRSEFRPLAGLRAIIEPSLLWRCVCMNQIE